MFKRLIALTFGLISCVEASTVRLEVYKGYEIAPYSHEMNRLSSLVYAEYPYLYDGTADDYVYYLNLYGQSPNTVICLGFDGDEAVGLATGIPMSENRPHYRAPFEQRGDDLDALFYIGELVLLPQYRREGIGMAMYNEIVKFARDDGRYKTLCFAQIDESTVQAEAPEGYQPIDPVCIKLGYVRHPELNFIARWKNIGGTENVPHHMIYWTLDLQ